MKPESSGVPELGVVTRTAVPLQNSIGAAPAIDTAVFLAGQVLAPPGILSNNGGSVIGQNGANIVSNNGANVIGQNGANVIGQNGANVIGQNGANVIGQNGANVIGQNGANVIGQNGANVIGQNGANVIGQNGANIISNNGGSLGQLPLAYASLKVVDATGKKKIGKNGLPLEGYSDGSGQFLIPRSELDANCVVLVTSPALSGELKAFVAKGGNGSLTLQIDMVSTMSTTYVLDKFVDGKQEVLDKLTGEIETEARADITTAIQANSTSLAESLSDETVIASVEELIDSSADVKDVFNRIEKLLIIVGITNNGEGRSALSTPLNSNISGLLATPNEIFMFSKNDHQLLRLSTDGILHNVVQQNKWPYWEYISSGYNWSGTSGMTTHDGWLYLCDTQNHRIVRINGDQVEVIAGDGTPDLYQISDGYLGIQTPTKQPSGIAVATDGTIYYGDPYYDRIRRIRTDNTVETIVGGGEVVDAQSPVPSTQVKLKNPQGLAFIEGEELAIADQGNFRIRKFDPKSGNVVDITNSNSFRPGALSSAKGKLFVFAEDVDSRMDGVYEVSGSTLININPIKSPESDFTPTLLSSFESGLTAIGDKYYIPTKEGFLIEVATSAPHTFKVVAGTTGKSVTNTITRASSFSINEAGEIVIADPGSHHVFLKQKDGPLKILAGNGEVGSTRESVSAASVPIADAIDIEWNDNNSITTLTNQLNVQIQRLTIDGTLTSPLADYVNDVEIKELLRLEDGKLLNFYYNNPVMYLATSGSRGLFPWPTVNRVSHVSKVGNRFVYYEDIWDAIVSHVGNTKTTHMSIQKLGQFMPYVTSSYGIRALAIDNKERLYIASQYEIFQQDLGTGTVRNLAGLHGVLLNKPTRDERLESIRDLEFGPDGDLFILEEDQVKKVPASLLTMP